MKPIKCDIYIILSFASNFYSDYRDSSHFISSNWIILSKKRRLWRGSRGKRWCSILSRAVVVRMDEPMRSVGWRRVLGWCKRSSYIYTHVIIYLIEVASRFAKLDTVWPLFDSFNLKMSKSAIWEGKCRPESLQRNTHSSKHLTSSKGHTSHEEKPLTFQYTGYLIIRDPNNGLLKYPPNWVVYGSIILYVPEKQPGALFFSASTYPQNP